MREFLRPVSITSNQLIFMALSCCFLCLPPSAMALDAGFASGALIIKSGRINLSHAYAWQHDGKELGNQGLRILLTEQEVPIDLLAGPLAFLPSRWAETGRLKGVLIRNDLRASPKVWKIQALLAQSLKLSTLDNIRYRLGPQSLRIAGDISLDGTESAQAFSIQAHFDAPVFRDEPVTADLKRSQARNSPTVTTLCAFNEAWRHRDWLKLQALSTQEKSAAMQPLILTYKYELATASPAQQAQLASTLLTGVDGTAKTRADVQRVVIRGQSAVILRKKLAPQAMRLEGGVWKVDF